MADCRVMGEQQKNPWWKRTWVWVVVGAVLVIGAIGNLLGLGGDEDPSAAPTETVAVQPSPEPSEVETPEPAESETPPIDEAARAEAFDDALRSALGVSEYSELLASDPSLWGGYVNGVRTDGGNAYVTLQITADEPGRDELGERAARAMSTLLPASAVDGVDWIIVEDAAGGMIAQERPSPLT